MGQGQATPMVAVRWSDAQYYRSKRLDPSILTSRQSDQTSLDSPIRAVILDFGEVISQPPDPEAIAVMAAMFNLPEGPFRLLYSAHRIPYDRGDMSAHEYWAIVAHSAGVELSAAQVQQLRETDIAMWSRLNLSVLRWADQLRLAGFQTAVLSNMHDDMVQYLTKDAGWAARFNCLTLSSAIHTAKPEAAIFEHCLQCLQVAPQEALFVDDREVNVRAAQALGMRGIVANSPAELRSQLGAIGFTPLPE